MRDYPTIVRRFPLRSAFVWTRLTQLPSDMSSVCFHYTNRAGLEGILRSGGLRASYRMTMNDNAEFSYARDLIMGGLASMTQDSQFSNALRSITEPTSVNLERLFDDSVDNSASYCACLSVLADDKGQWVAYSDEGRGFSIGLDIPRSLLQQAEAQQNEEPFLVFVPVSYSPELQRDLVRHQMLACQADLEAFSRQVSSRGEHLTALRDRLMEVCVANLFVMANFLKAPEFSCEREIRIIRDPNDGTEDARGVSHVERNGQKVPFLFFDLRNRESGLLPLGDVWTGPNCSSSDEEFANALLAELGYKAAGGKRKKVVHSTIGS